MVRRFQARAIYFHPAAVLVICRGIYRGIYCKGRLGLRGISIPYRDARTFCGERAIRRRGHGKVGTYSQLV